MEEEERLEKCCGLLSFMLGAIRTDVMPDRLIDVLACVRKELGNWPLSLWAGACLADIELVSWVNVIRDVD